MADNMGSRIPTSPLVARALAELGLSHLSNGDETITMADLNTTIEAHPDLPVSERIRVKNNKMASGRIA